MNNADTTTVKELLDRYALEHNRVHDVELKIHARELELSDAKFAKANEMREQIDKERGEYATKEKLETINLELIRRIAALEKSEAALKGKIYGAGAVISLVSVLIGIVSHFWK